MELMVVMAIIGVLTIIGLGSFQGSQQKARDAQRKSDLKQMTTALETYYNDAGEYPLSNSSGEIVGCGTISSPTACSWGESFATNTTTYMVELPEAPASQQYDYISDGDSYAIFARLENGRDPDIPEDTDGIDQVYDGTDCGTGVCNYGISSPNIRPTEKASLTTP